MLNNIEMYELRNAVVNILAVEHLVKENNDKEYSRKLSIFSTLNDVDLLRLHIKLSLNMHIENLGCMITQGDYDYQRDKLFSFLDKARTQEAEVSE